MHSAGTPYNRVAYEPAFSYCVAITLASSVAALTSQELHTDADNGPFSFTLSLTRWDERRFTGGETVLLAPRVLDYWAAPLSGEVRQDTHRRVWWFKAREYSPRSTATSRCRQACDQLEEMEDATGEAPPHASGRTLQAWLTWAGCCTALRSRHGLTQYVSQRTAEHAVSLH